MQPINELPHRRFNPLTRTWTLAAVGRTRRPWSGQLEPFSGSRRPEYDPDCYLCPRNTRAGGAVNPDDKARFVFTKDFASPEEVAARLPAVSGIHYTRRRT